VLVAETADGMRLILVAGPGEPRVLKMPGAHLLPQSEPALRIASDGHVNASVLVAIDADLHRIATADVTWPPGNETGDFALKMATTLATAPQAAATTYSVAPEGGAVPRRDWVILLADGTVAGNRFPNTPRHLTGEPVRPLELLGMSQLPYLLVHDADTVLRLQGLN
jgi:hypothetical protein